GARAGRGGLRAAGPGGTGVAAGTRATVGAVEPAARPALPGDGDLRVREAGLTRSTRAGTVTVPAVAGQHSAMLGRTSGRQYAGRPTSRLWSYTSTATWPKSRRSTGRPN